jgi:cathepsin L
MFAALLAVAAPYDPRTAEERSFVRHMRVHGLMYAGKEYHSRFGLYLASARYVQEHNAGNHGFQLALNRFATMTDAEYQVLLGHRSSDVPVKPLRAPRAEVPESKNWTAEGKVQTVKDQGQCGSCWAFGAIGAQESMWAIKTGELLNLSEQNLIECVATCLGCSGGNAGLAYHHIITKQGGTFNKEEDYSYLATDALPCHFNPANGLSKIADFAQVIGNEENLKQVVARYGPVAIAIDASKKSFNLYKGGIYNDPKCSSTRLDHEVLLTGYGQDEDEIEYWIVKNSWGLAWGEHGYIRMSRNKGNQCGVATEAILPFLDPI